MKSLKMKIIQIIGAVLFLCIGLTLTAFTSKEAFAGGVSVVPSAIFALISLIAGAMLLFYVGKRVALGDPALLLEHFGEGEVFRVISDLTETMSLDDRYYYIVVEDTNGDMRFMICPCEKFDSGENPEPTYWYRVTMEAVEPLPIRKNS